MRSPACMHAHSPSDAHDCKLVLAYARINSAHVAHLIPATPNWMPIVQEHARTAKPLDVTLEMCASSSPMLPCDLSTYYLRLFACIIGSTAARDVGSRRLGGWEGRPFLQLRLGGTASRLVRSGAEGCGGRGWARTRASARLSLEKAHRDEAETRTRGREGGQVEPGGRGDRRREGGGEEEEEEHQQQQEQQ